MATKYVSKDAWGFQYVLEDTKPFCIALVSQGATTSDTPITDVLLAVKPIFPGSSNLATSQVPLY